MGGESSEEPVATDKSADEGGGDDVDTELSRDISLFDVTFIGLGR